MIKQDLYNEARLVLMQTSQVISKLDYDEYIIPLKVLSGSSIGQHTRHIIELFEQLLIGYAQDRVNYDNRKRNVLLQDNIDFAIESIAQLINNLQKEDKTLWLEGQILGKSEQLKTTYLRELLYNIEHCVHHQALIKVGLITLNICNEDSSFGVARSTLEYKKNHV